MSVIRWINVYDVYYVRMSIPYRIHYVIYLKTVIPYKIYYVIYILVAYIHDWFTKSNGGLVEEYLTLNTKQKLGKYESRIVGDSYS